MHELSIALSILEIVEEEGERQSGRIVAVHLKLGPLSGVVKDALLSAFDLAREGTPFAEAELIVDAVPVTAYCPSCAADRTPASAHDLCCPECSTPMPEVLSGR